MRKYQIFCFLLLTCLGCKKVDKLTQFNMEFNEEIVIPSSTGINLPFNILTPDIETNSASTFEGNKTRNDLIEQIKLKTLELSIISPANADFSFLKSISIFISAKGLSETKVAWKENIVGNETLLKLDVSDTDLKEYIKSDKFSLRLNTETDELLASDHKIKVHSVFFVDAKILGQ